MYILDYTTSVCISCVDVELCQVIVRMRPLNKKEILEEATQVVQKLSPNSLSLAEQQFTYDAVAGENESQVCMEY